MSNLHVNCNLGIILDDVNISIPYVSYVDPYTKGNYVNVSMHLIKAVIVSPCNLVAYSYTYAGRMWP